MELIDPKQIEGCKCENIDKSESVKELALEMINFMDSHNGIGLAAPQIGVFKRLFVMKNFRGEGSIIVVDPVIIWKSEKIGTFEEGCLSYPGKLFRVKRHKQIKAIWRNEKGEPFKMKMSGKEAQVFQHEYDHLDGIMLANK